MSHTVKITTTSTSNSNSIILNSGYLKTVPGLLKLGELILGIVTVGIVAYYYTNNYNVNFHGDLCDLFFFLMTTTFMICTFCLLLSCLVSWSTGGLISKTMFELIYHVVATILLLAASVNLLIKVSNMNAWNRQTKVYDAYMAASIIGLVNTVLYLFSAIFAQRQYRGI